MIRFLFYKINCNKKNKLNIVKELRVESMEIQGCVDVICCKDQKKNI